MNEEDYFRGLSFSSELRQMGIDGLRVHVAARTWATGSPVKHAEAIEAIRRAEVSLAEASANRREEREERMVASAEAQASLASKAASAAVEQARWAKWAAIIAAVAAVIATKEQIIALITGHP